MVNNCTFLVSNSYFYQNQVYYGYRLGGSIAVYRGIMYIVGTILSNSRAQMGAVVYLSESLGVFNLSSISSSAAIDDGGGVYSVNSSIHFYRNTFINNFAAQGGVLFISKSTAVIENCSFVGNSVQGDGGVIYAYNESSLITKSCHFKNNSAAISGAVMCVESTSQEIRIEKCEFLYNRAEIDGGVFYFTRSTIRATMGNKRTNVIMKESKFLNNKAGAAGGVIYSINSNFNIKDSGNIYHCNAAKDGGVMQISNSTLVASNIHISVNNAFQQGIVLISSRV